LEALYYKFAPCTLTLRTWDGYFPFFEHHPLVYDLIPFQEGEDELLAEFDEQIGLPEIEQWHVVLPAVQKFAASAGVTLSRQTPAIFLDERPPDWNGVIITDNIHDVWSSELASKLGESGIETLQFQNSGIDTKAKLKLMSSASLVVGPDNWMTQAAAALNTRVVIGMSEEAEKLRRPFNTIVSRLDSTDIFGKIAEIWYEKKYPDYLNFGNQCENIKNKAKEYMKSSYVDIGSSQWPMSNSIAVDISNREIIEQAKDGAFAGAFSSHCLEHIEDWEKELALWHRIIRQHGILFMYLPHPNCEPWHAETGSWVGKEHVWNPEPITLVRHLREVLNFDILEYTSRQDPFWGFHIIARKR
jgi:hypothetical protein